MIQLRNFAISLAVALLLLLSACVPAVYAPLPPEEPIAYQATYDDLFAATLQALTTSYVESSSGERVTFAIVEASHDTGLIRVVNEGIAKANFSGWYGPIFEDDGFFSPNDRTFYKTQSVISLVIRRTPEAATLAYSSTNSRGVSSNLANSYMLSVIAKLNEDLALPSPNE